MSELPFVSVPPGDLATATRVACAAASSWGLAGPVHLRTGMNALFLAGSSTVLRVSRTNASPAQAMWMHQQLAQRGVRVPRMVRAEPFEAEGLAVFALERIEPVAAVDWAQVGAMVRAVHQWPVTDVEGNFPLPQPERFPWWSAATQLAESADLLDESALQGLSAAIDAHGGWSTLVRERVVCHGDVHPGNVLQSAQGPVLIDWDLVCWGPPAWDHAPLLTWASRWGGSPATYPAFVAGYGQSLVGDPLAESLAVMRNVVATLMRVRAGRHDPAAAQEAERRLRHWRGQSDAPQWKAQ